MKVALVTGGGSGMGEATCLAFAREGANVATLDFNLESAEKVASNLKKLGQKTIALKVDIADFKGGNACVQKVYDEFKRIDILINGAGYGKYVLFAELTEKIWDRSIVVHLKGTFNATRAVINGMIAQRSGKIVSISSGAGVIGTPKHSHYSAAKAGIIGMSKALAKEVAPYGINVNVIAPGTIDSPYLNAMKREDPDLLEKHVKNIPIGRLGKVEEIAALALFLCSEDAAYMTGQVISPNGGTFM